MPTYDYHCPENGQTIEVFHSMSTTLATWGDLCDAAEHDPGDTPRCTPIERQTGAGLMLGDAGDGAAAGGGHGPGCPCCSSMASSFDVGD